MLVGIMLGGIMLVFIMPGVIRFSVIWLDVVVPTGLAFKKKIKKFKILEKEKKPTLDLLVYFGFYCLV
jgi:hypothetical protein